MAALDYAAYSIFHAIVINRFKILANYLQFTLIFSTFDSADIMLY